VTACWLCNFGKQPATIADMLATVTLTLLKKAPP
jgi:hypothetical protein